VFGCVAIAGRRPVAQRPLGLPPPRTYGQRRPKLLDEYCEIGENRSAMAEAKRLLLLRHAKSSWDDPALADCDRPLAARGRKAAKLIGAHLRREQIRLSLGWADSS